jgi:hypothetical protein
LINGHSISFDTYNHDELIEIIHRIQNSGQFSKDESTSFAVGLKLFGETMLQNKESELFSEIKPHLFDFMKKLKASLKNS